MLRLTAPRLWLRSTLLLVLAAPIAPGQTRTFAPRQPMGRVAAHDITGFVRRAMQGRLGQLLDDPEIREAVDVCIRRELAGAAAWRELIAALAKESPRSVRIEERIELALRTLDWRDLQAFELCASMPNAEAIATAPDILALQTAMQTEVSLALNPVPTAAGRWRRWSRALLDNLRQSPPFGLQPARPADPEDSIGAIALAQNDEVDPVHAALSFGHPTPAAMWAIDQPGLLVGGTGSPAIGEFGTRAESRPSLSAGIDLRRYLLMIAALTSNSDPTRLFEAAALTNSGLLQWRLHPVGDRMQDEFHWSFDGEVGGILGALLTAVAPLPEQPLPENAMLQLRAAFDVPALVAAVDRLLDCAKIRTLTADGLSADLRLTWTGGMAFAVTRPQLGQLVPRLYASFGIVDPLALERLLGRLHEQPWLAITKRKLEGVDCTLLKIEGLPAALTPAYCLLDGTMHIAETAASLRALLKARGAGAPPAMPLDDAPRPRGDGLLSPAFDLRYDNAAIHRALREIWLPLMTKALLRYESDAYLRLDELPDSEVVTAFLGSGRGVLRRTSDGVALAMSGTIGGPVLTSLATIFGPAISSVLTEERRAQRGDLLLRLAGRRMQEIDRSRVTFTARESRPPRSLGELVAAGDLDVASLTVPTTTKLEPVLHDGKELGKSSFRFYPEGLRATIEGHDSAIRVVSIEPMKWYRLVLSVKGGLHQGWGAITQRSLDELEAIGREKAKHR
ncbi:MAG: hypothetical protein NXI31_06915 [bacterium]|nr:hypothetical protein [bacterium]